MLALEQMIDRGERLPDFESACLTGAGRAEAFPSLGQMSDGQNPKRAPSLRGPSAAMSSSLPDTQKGSQPGSAPKMGFANAVSGEPC